ncbi:MAG: DUF3325 domain-containing protein [Myxococcales bacterium]|nr:MAG: DUF3325 domain-containing protein [Myxococcales bacterium]
MAEALLFAAALLFGYCGMGWLALAKAAHWEQARGRPRPSGPSTRMLQGLGAAALAGSLALCLLVDHATMASLVWVMLLTGSALLVTFTLAWRPRWLKWLVIWVR